MLRVRARVQGRRRKADDPLSGPDNRELELNAMVAEVDEPDADELDEVELRRLDEVIDRSDAQIARRQTVPFEAVLGDIRRILYKT